jgi:protocadherin alpha
MYNLEIMASDVGDLSDKIEVTINVLDINDNWPHFDVHDTLEYKINENEQDWQIHLNASDLDAGQNGTLMFYMDPTLNSMEILQKFRVDPMSGWLELITPLDYETKQTYKLAVICSDLGVPQQLKTTQELTIDVVDLNDNGYVLQFD